MDAALQATMEAQLQTFADGILSVIGAVLPIAFGVAVSIVGLVIGIRWFRKLVGF